MITLLQYYLASVAKGQIPQVTTAHTLFKEEFARLKAVQLITITNDQEFDITPEGADYLKQLQAREIYVVGVAGGYRQGKSFLLNLLTGSTAFAVGNTTTGHTKGIWIWADLQDDDRCVLYLDSAGLWDLENESAFDSKLLSLLVLMSSYLVFNTLSALDTVSLGKLSYLQRCLVFYVQDLWWT